jgi:hypothetical protein
MKEFLSEIERAIVNFGLIQVLGEYSDLQEMEIPYLFRIK